jgi:uncharacterized protein (DUF1778 family)
MDMDCLCGCGTPIICDKSVAAWSERLADEYVRTLSARDSEALLEMLDNPPEPTAEALEAMKRFRETVRTKPERANGN